MTGVWFSYVITDYLSFGIAAGISIWFRKKVLDTWPAVVDNNKSNESSAEESKT